MENPQITYTITTTPDSCIDINQRVLGDEYNQLHNE